MTMATHFSAERISATLARARAFWRGEWSGPLVSIYHQPTYRQEPDAERMVAGAVDCIRRDGAGGEPDILPTFWPDFGTVSTAAMWGGKRIPATDGGSPHIEPVGASVTELLALTPCVYEESDFQRGAALYRQVCDRLGTGEVWTRTPDFQGPMNTLALLMDQTDLMCALYDEPEAVKVMLARITDTLIATVRRYIDDVGVDRMIGNSWPFVILPADMGICITQDYMPLLGPEVYLDFEVPELRRIAEAFGGLCIHCCGTYGRHLRTLRDPALKVLGLEMFVPPTPPARVHEVFGPDIVYIPNLGPGAETQYKDWFDFVPHLASSRYPDVRWWIATCHEWVDAARLHAAVAAAWGPAA